MQQPARAAALCSIIIACMEYSPRTEPPRRPRGPPVERPPRNLRNGIVSRFACCALLAWLLAGALLLLQLLMLHSSQQPAATTRDAQRLMQQLPPRNHQATRVDQSLQTHPLAPTITYIDLRQNTEQFHPALLEKHRPYTKVMNPAPFRTTFTLAKGCPVDQIIKAQQHPDYMPYEQFLVYGPQFGLSNQLIALANAVAWARLLNRTLVLPDLLAHGAITPRAPFDHAFNVSSALWQVRQLRVISMDAFLRLRKQPGVIITLSTKNKFRWASLDYLTAMGLTDAGNLPEIVVKNIDFTPASIVRTFGNCKAHDVLMFRSLYAAYQKGRGWFINSSRGGRVLGDTWLRRQALPALLTPADALATAVRGIVDQLQLQAATQNGSSTDMMAVNATGGAGGGFACAHIRQGDFTAECRKYAVENEKSATARRWVRQLHLHGVSCLQMEDDLVRNLGILTHSWAASRLRSAPPPVIYVSIEDPTKLQQMLTLPQHLLRTQGDYAAVVRAASLPLPASLASALVDQLVCAEASSLLLNAFSTFSLLVLGWIGNRHPAEIGWEMTDLKYEHRFTVLRHLGVHLAYWMTKGTSP